MTALSLFATRCYQQTVAQTRTHIGQIQVDEYHVYTPVGTLERRSAIWWLGGATAINSSCPGWAQALAIVLIPCTGFLSLFLLLVKETDTWSSPIRVTDGKITFETVVYTQSQAQWIAIRDAVAWAQIPPPPFRPDTPALPAAPDTDQTPSP